MPVHVEEMHSEVTVLDGDLPLTAAQIDKLVKIILDKLEERGREARRRHEAIAVRDSVVPGEPGDSREH